MAKLISLVLVVAVVAVCLAEPARLRNSKQSRFFARQQLAEDVPAQTPYPPSGLIPDIPFDLPNEPQEPDNTYLPPDNLLPPAETYGAPDQFYGPPEASGNGPVADDDAVEDVPQVTEQADVEQAAEPLDEQNELAAAEPEAEEVDNSQSERLVLARSFRKQSRRPAKLRLAKLQAVPVARVRSQKLVAQRVYSAKGALLGYKVLRV